ncbi:aspartate--tRNA ligase [Patescibacteria group bacterium]|nr:aspartate--tRNA ligase [Patescibacteria group bacterium]
MNRILSLETVGKIGEEVLLKGWVNARRNMGKIAFLDLRDRAGLVQVVGVPNELDEASNEDLKKARLEYCLEIRGLVQERGEKQKNLDLPTGTAEILAKEIKILSESESMPIDVSADTKNIDEAVRLKYRYLDLRSDRMKKNLELRHAVNKFFRDYLCDQGFWEIETPTLTKGTPEGAREYIIPSRLYQGQFYVLPQAPQQFKQLLMVSGVEKYFQIARCFRDEDQRGDRQPEFTQLDMEMSFVEREDVMGLVENMMIKMAEKVSPEKKIQQVPFPRLTYKEAMDKYGTDKPDLREDKNDPNLLAFCWIIDFPFFEKTEEGGWTFTHNPFSAAMPEYKEQLLQKKDIEKIIAAQYDLALNGYEVGGGSVRNHESVALRSVLEIIGFDEEQISEQFGHILEAFKYGPPPHGGIAPGIDRLVMILANEPNIREVIPFPKNGDARDLMMGAPSPLPQKVLDEAHIKLK